MDEADGVGPDQHRRNYMHSCHSVHDQVSYDECHNEDPSEEQVRAQVATKKTLLDLCLSVPRRGPSTPLPLRLRSLHDETR